MHRGQISLDLLFTLLITFVVIASFSYLITQTKSVQETTLTQNQLVHLTTTTANFITASQALDDSNYRISLPLDPIAYIDAQGTTQKVYPTFTILNQTILHAHLSITSATGAHTFDANAFFARAPTTQLTFDTLSPNGTLVIMHE